MNYYAQTFNFREVEVGDTFTIALEIADDYVITENTTIRMEVKVAGDYESAPILVLESGDGITANGQEFTLFRSAEQMRIRTGKFSFTIRFTKDGISTTLYKGLFEVVDHNL